MLRTRFYLVALAILSLAVTYLALPQGVLPMGGDALPLFNPAQLPRYSSAWNYWIDLGSGIPAVLAGPPLTDAAFFSFLNLIGIDGTASSWLYVAIFSLVGAIGTAYLFRTVFPSFRASQTAAILAGTVFMINPSIIVDTFKSLLIGLPERAIFPVFLGLFINGYQTRRMRFSVAAGVLTSILLARFPVLTGQYFVAILVSVGAYVGVALLWGEKAPQLSRFSAKYLLVTLTTSFFVNFYLLIPALLDFSFLTSTIGSFAPNYSLNSWSTLFNAARLIGYWAFYEGYVPYSSVYITNPIVIFATLALPFFSVLTLLINRTKRVTAITVVCVALLFLSKGNNDPFGQSFVSLTSIPVLKVFYVSAFLAPFVVLSYSLLTPAFFAKLHNLRREETKRLRRISEAGLLIFLIVGMLVASWPILTGAVSTNYWQPTLHGVNIPNAYSYLKDWLTSNATPYRTLLAYEPSVYVATSWGFQGATQFYQLYFDNSIVTGTGTQYSAKYPFLDFIYNVNHFDRLQSASISDLENVTITPWTSYQNDNITLTASGYDSHPGLIWQIQSMGPNAHEIAYLTPQKEDWSNRTLLSLWAVGTSNLSTLSIGIGDDRGSVGWYDAVSHERTITAGWTQLLLPLRTPDQSNFNRTSVRSIWARDFTSSDRIKVSLFQLGQLNYDSIAWAKLLALAGVKWIIRDDSLVEGRWVDYGILNATNAFSVSFHREFLTVYANAFTPTELYTASSLVSATNLFNAVDAINQTSFVPSQWAFVNSSTQIAPFSHNGTAHLQVRSLPNAGYDVTVSSVSPFIVVLGQQFDARWILSGLDGVSVEHTQVNGYANGWLISSAGYFHFEITFAPQSYFLLAEFVSLGAVFVASLIVLLPTWILGRITEVAGRAKSAIFRKPP